MLRTKLTWFLNVLALSAGRNLSYAGADAVFVGCDTTEIMMEWIEKAARFLRAKKRRLALLLLAAVVLSLPVSQSACGGKSVLANLQAIVAGAQDVVNAITAADPGFTTAQKFLNDAKALLAAYIAATAKDPSGCTGVAVIASRIATAFQTAILPLFVVNPLVAAAIAGIDVALRLVVANFSSCVTKALASPTARRVLGRQSDDLEESQGVFKRFLALPKLVPVH